MKIVIGNSCQIQQVRQERYASTLYQPHLPLYRSSLWSSSWVIVRTFRAIKPTLEMTSFGFRVVEQIVILSGLADTSNNPSLLVPCWLRRQSLDYYSNTCRDRQTVPFQPDGPQACSSDWSKTHGGEAAELGGCPIVVVTWGLAMAHGGR